MEIPTHCTDKQGHGRAAVNGVLTTQDVLIRENCSHATGHLLPYHTCKTYSGRRMLGPGVQNRRAAEAKSLGAKTVR